MKHFLITLLLITTLLSNEQNSDQNKESQHLPFSITVLGGVDYLSSSWLDKPWTNSVQLAVEYRPTEKLTLFSSYFNVRSRDFQIGSRYNITPTITPSITYALHRFKLYDDPIYEHNIILRTNCKTKEALFRLQGELGWNFRFVDFGDQHPYSSSFPVWAMGVVTVPTDLLELSLLIDNLKYDTPISFSYIEAEIQTHWHFPHNITAAFNTGIAFSGTFAVAGFLDRYFFQLGIIYEV